MNPKSDSKSNRSYIIFFCIAAICGLLFISACADNNKPEDMPPNNQPGDSANPEPDNNGQEPPDESAEQMPEQTPEQTTEELDPPEPEVIAKQYHMNKNYIIVPDNPETTDKKVVLLTFDDGPKDREMIESLLDVLDKHQAKAIFFVNGYRVKANPDLLKLIAEREQVIGNHSWDHINLKEESAESIYKQIIDVQEIVEELTGERPQFFRPPHGASNENVRKTANDEGMLFMTWSNGSLDWDMGKIPEDQRPAAIIDNVMEQLHAGSNILMHELPWTVAALDDLLTALTEKGYSFVDPRSIRLEQE